MQIGSIVKENLTDQVGIIKKVGNHQGNNQMVRVYWYVQGSSMWNDYSEWKNPYQLEVICK